MCRSGDRVRGTVAPLGIPQIEESTNGKYCKEHIRYKDNGEGEVYTVSRGSEPNRGSAKKMFDVRWPSRNGTVTGEKQKGPMPSWPEDARIALPGLTGLG